MTSSDEPREEADGVASDGASGKRNDGVIRTGEPIGIGNEFSGVVVRKVWTRNGERLEIRVPRKDYYILLDAMQLEIIAAQKPQEFTRLFQRQFGSED
ncbi:hypothetical protein [Paenarthrobacter nitroguajacolicus]|uniref:hypothetical protein n=1 Tax=Paenarthrobacter nitroguajacolicus TaxID=211146 RepID=UPI003433984A